MPIPRATARVVFAVLTALWMGGQGGALEAPGAGASDVGSCFGEEPTVIAAGPDRDVSGTAGDDVILGGRVARGGAGDDLICDAVLALGGAGADRLRVSGFGTARGGAGPDGLIGISVRAGPSVLRLEGGRGADVLWGSAAGDSIRGGRGRDVVRAGGGNDLVRLGRGMDWVGGGPVDDALFGGAGDDTLLGGDGVDEANGQAGTNVCAAVETFRLCTLVPSTGRAPR